MARLITTFDGADPSELPAVVARTNADNLSPGDIIPGVSDDRWRVLSQATAFDYLAQCSAADVEVDEDKVMEETDCMWWVEAF